MDWLDSQLYKMEKPLPPTSMQKNLREQFLKRQQRHQRWVFFLGIACDFIGLALLLPSLKSLIGWINNISLEYSHLSQFIIWMIDGKAQWATLLNLDNFQMLVTSTITATTWIGLLILAAGTGVNLANWLPTQLREA